MSKLIREKRRAFTLIELMIATVITLLMMAALAQGFKQLSDSMTEGRSRLALTDKLRGVAAIIRNDLENCTAKPIPPLEEVNGSGYFEYIDGGLSDYAATYYGFDSTASGTEQIALSRFGDVDDILMFTARSKGEPFKGKIPTAIVKAAQGQVLTNGDWDSTVTISSEYAEIIYFMLPAPSPDAIATGVFYDSNTGMPNFVPAGSGFPAKFQLFRRVLLIRPDLNVVTAALTEPHLTNDLVQGSLGPVIANTSAAAPLQMANAFQRCDLSMRRIRGASTLLAANSLEDLKRRENRFAHFVIPNFPGSGNTSMPIVALTSALPMAYSGNSVAFGGSPNFSGFLRPEYVLGGARLGEDMLLSNAIAFDIKGFDPLVQCLYHSGVDGTWGTNGSNAGANGSDDFVLSPNDPQYFRTLEVSNVNNLAYQGEFVDLAWGAKVVSIMRRAGVAPSINAVTIPRWTSHLSGFDAAPGSAGFPFTNSLLKSGVVARNAAGADPTIYQPTYDTWATSYETDNQFVGISGETAFWTNGNDYFGFTTNGIHGHSSSGRGTNGIDDNSNGVVDDLAEQETSPPFLHALSAIRIEIRAEDDGTGVMQQTSVVQDFVSH